MKKLETIENEVKKILDKDIRARKDDMYLYYKYCTRILNDNAFVQLFWNRYLRAEYKIPAFESVSRARRKLQKNYPNMIVRMPFLSSYSVQVLYKVAQKTTGKLKDARINKEADYIRYAIDDSRSSNFKKLINQD